MAAAVAGGGGGDDAEEEEEEEEEDLEKLQAEIADASGDTERAAIYRTAFEELWSNADPEMLAEVSR